LDGVRPQAEAQDTIPGFWPDRKSILEKRRSFCTPDGVSAIIRQKIR
jgi:hypothetical protein